MMSDLRTILERGVGGATPPPDGFERMLRRRDRKRRNQRIAAGVVGMAVFVAAVWIVTSVWSLDRGETSVVPGGDVTGPVETGPAETAPPPARASAAPDVVNRGSCSLGFFGPAGEARWWLELTDLGDRIRVRFDVHQSPPGDRWTIRISRHGPHSRNYLVFQGTMVASDGGDFVVQRFYWDNSRDGFRVTARDWQTDLFCWAEDWIG
jgi:hypothetical protein